MPSYTSLTACNVLIRSSIDLRLLYGHAASDCEPGLRMVLDENVRTLEMLIADLQAQLRASGVRPRRHGSWRGATRRQLTRWLVRTTGGRDRVWLHALAHHERDLLHAFEQTIAALPPESALTLRRQLPRLQGIHLDMDSLVGSAH